MFTNIGKKIKMLAKVICWMGIAIAAITGIVMMIAANFWWGLLAIAVGAVGSWVGSFVLYGFGQLVENSDIQTELAARRAAKN